MSASPVAVSKKRLQTAGDSFAVGVMVMLFVSVFQRSVGLLRGIGFCHYLNDIELGHWALASSFFVIGVPIAVLGLPGSFGKFSEYYRSRNQLGEYCKRVTLVSIFGLLTTSGLILAFPSYFSWLILGEEKPLGVIAWCVVGLIAAAAFSFVNELVGSLRQVRVVSIMQFTQSLTFAVVGIVLIALYRNWVLLLPSFAIASIVGMLPGLWVIRAEHAHEFRGKKSRKRVGRRKPKRPAKRRPAVARSDARLSLWRRIIPYAAALWLMNLLGNLFGVSDRYMLLHLSPGGESVGQALVGQYHAGYILPNLLISLALMLSGILLPYLSADWEANRHEQIAARLRQMLQSVAIGFIAISVGAMMIAPLLYGLGFGGRYQLAEQILPIALTQATFVSLFFVAESYMLCAERGKQLAVLLCLGLAVNFLLNWLLIQSWGLLGAVVATSTANFLVLIVLLGKISHRGLHLGYGTLALCFAPLAILAGPIPAMTALFVILLIAGRTEWLLTASDRRAIDAAILPKLQKLGLSVGTVWP